MAVVNKWSWGITRVSDNVDFSGLRFLVVDDNQHVRRIIRTLLHGFGVREVYEAADGAAGLDAVQNFLPDFIITDWVMPLFDGLEFVQMIRQPDSNLNPYVPIIMLSAHSERHRVLEARDAGVNDFLCKPISAKSLHQRISAILLSPRPFIRATSYFGPDRRRQTAAVAYRGPERRVEQSGVIEVESPLARQSLSA